MTTANDSEIRAFLADEARRALTAAPSLDEAIGRLAPRVAGRPTGASHRLIVLLAASLLLVAALGTAIALGSGILRLPLVNDSEEPSVDLGIFEPVAGRIVYGFDNSEGETYRVYGEDGIWGLDPASSGLATPVQLTSEPGTPLGWSSDGTRLLIQRGNQNLVVLHSDGSETLVTEQPWGLKGASISPDGSRVAFGALLEENDEHGGLFAVDADGGRAELLWESQFHILRSPTFSPDGTQIAFVDDNIDSIVSVWVINADGTDAHQIVPSGEPFGAGRVRGLAWSPAGDRIALMAELDEDPDPTTPLGLYTFAPDGSDFRRVADAGVDGYVVIGSPYWSSDGTLIEYTTGCNGSNAENQVFGCMLVIVDVDGSVVRTFLDGVSGPWHPGTSESDD